MSEYVVAQAAVLVVPSLKGFAADLEKKLKAQKHEIEVMAKANTKPMLAEVGAAKAYLEGKDIELTARVDVRPLTEIRHKYEDLQRDMRKGLMLNLKVAGMSLLPQLSQGLAAANASIVQLSQSAMVLPGVFSGVAASISTIITGMGGIKDAFKEYSDAQKNSLSDGQKARSAALNLNNAYRDLGRTLKDAQRSLEDLNAELRDAPLDEADAIIRVQEAQAEAANAFGKTALQRQKDIIALKKAENDLADTRLRNSRLVQDVAEANAKGVAGADSVRDATDRLSKALDDVNTKSGKLSDSFAQLSPNAQAFVKAITGMQSQWDAFRGGVQDRLFAGLDADITQLAQVGLPALEKGLGGIADALNGNVKAAFKELGSASNIGFFDRIFGNTADAQGRLSKALDPFTDALLRLSAAGSDMLPRLADGLTDVLTRFDNFIVRAEGDGSLEKWMNNGLDALTDLGNSLLNVGSILNSVAEAFTGSGGQGMLGALESGTERLAEFLRSAEGQEKLTSFFQDMRDELAEWKPLLSLLPELMGHVAEAGQQWADMLMPFLRTAASMLADHPVLIQAMFTAFLAWKGIVPILKGVYSGMQLMNNAFAALQTSTDKSGNKVSVFKDKLGQFGKVLGGAGGITTIVGIAATAIATDLAGAHATAEAAAERQRLELDKLKTSLDEVTGAATGATNKLIADNLLNATNEATGVETPNLGKLLPNPKSYVDAVREGDLQAALGMIPQKATAADIKNYDGGKFWRENSESLSKAGLTPELIADAVNGEPGAKKRFEDWQYDVMRDKAPPGFTSRPTLNWLEDRGLITGTTDLADIQSSLPEQTRLGSALAGETYTQIGGLQQGGEDIRTRNQYAMGRARLKPGGPFDALGVVGEPQLAADGSGAGLVVSSQPADVDALRSAGVTFTPDGGGKFIVNLSPEAANMYLERYASGGRVSGPGSGTSDSILARLSNGEFVVNAGATAQHLPLLEAINGGGLPGFSGGGFVFPLSPQPPKPPAPSPSPSSFLDVVKNPPPKKLTVGGGAGVSSGTFSPPMVPSPQYDNAVRGAVGSIGRFFKGALGLGGHAETSMATVSTADSAWNSLTAPAPAAPAKPPINPIDSKGAALSNLYGLPSDLKPSTVPFPNAGGGGSAPVAPKPASSGPAPVSSGTGPTATKPLPAESGYTQPHFGGGVPAGPVPHLSGRSPGLANAGAIAVPSSVLMPSGLAGQSLMPRVGNSEAGLQVNTIGIKRVLENAFPGITDIGGFREDAIEDHPSGKAIDVMIPGWDTPEGKAYGDQIVAFLRANGSAMGVDSFIWQDTWHDLNGNSSFLGRAAGQGATQGHLDHIHIKTTGGGFPTGLESYGIPGLSGSPSNLPAALTPAGVGLPQLSFGQGQTGSGGGNIIDNYMKSVADSWQGILQNLVQNAGQIALKFIGSFFGLDFSPLLGIANSAMGGLGGVSSLMDGGSGGGSPANGAVDAILAQYGSLPPEYQKMFDEAAAANPGNEASLMQQVIALAQQQIAGSNVYDPSGGAEQWRGTVRSILQKVAPKYGITNIQAWEDALVRQIQTESGGNPGAENLNDTDGRGGTQQVFGLGQFLPSTFAAHNPTGGSINDPVAQIYAMVDYVASKYGMDASGAPNQIGRGVGYASGGLISGPGNGRSDSIIARVSNGEYIVRAPMADKHLGLLNAINANKVPGFADGMMWPVNAPAPVTPPPVTTPTPPPAPVAPDPAGPAADAAAGQPSAPAPVAEVAGPGDAESSALQQMGQALGGLGSSLSGGGAAGAEAPAGGNPEGDPRAALMAAPQNLDHNKPAVSQGIQAAGAAISGAINTAIQAASAAGSMGASAAAPGAGQGVGAAAGAASSLISGLVSAGSGAVSGAVNILSSLGVGTVTPGGTSTGGAYGTPLLPGGQQPQGYQGPQVVNNWNGGVHTSNNEEFYKVQQRRELQAASPYLPQR